jgi:CHAT domain-containing protein/Tfp pilus assembly protein PilF
MSRRTFTQRFVVIFLTSFLFCLPLYRPSFAQTSPQDEASLRRFIEKYFTAYEKRDLNELIAMWSEKSPNVASNKKTLQELFSATQKIEIKALNISAIAMDKDKVRIRLSVELNALDSKTGENLKGAGKLNRTLHLVKESEEWKIWQNLSSEEELAAALVEAKTGVERKQLLESDKQLVTTALLQILLTEGRRLYVQGNSTHALAIYQLSEELANQLDDKKSTINALRGIGNIYLRQSNYFQAMEYFQKGLKIAEEIGDKIGINNTLTNIGIVLRYQSQSTQAMEYFQRSLKIAEEIGDKAGASNALINIGLVHQLQGNYARTLEFYQKSLKLKEEIGDKPGIGGTLNNIGLVYRYQGNYRQAIDYFQRSLKIAEETRNKIGISSALGNIGGIQQSQGNYAQALEYFHRCLTIMEEIGDKSGIGGTLNNIGLVYRYQGNYRQAMEYYQKGLKIAEEVGGKNEIVEALINIGSVHQLQGNQPQTMECYQKSLEIAQQIGDKAKIGGVLGNIGIVHQAQGNYAQAMEYYRKSLKIAEEIGDKTGISNAFTNIGVTYQLQSNYTQAMEYHQKSLKIIEEMGDKFRIGKALNNIAIVYQSQGNFQQAIKTATQSIDIGKQCGAPDLIWESFILAGMGYQAFNQPKQAKQAFADAIAAIEETRNQMAGAVAHRRQFFEGKLSAYYGMVSLLLEENNPAGALAFAEQAKARSLLDVLQTGTLNITRAMSFAEKQQEQKINSELVSLNEQIYREKLLKQQDQNRLHDLNARLQKVRLDMEAFQTSLYAAHPELKIRRGQAQTITLSETAALIPDSKTALLEFVVSEDQTYLFVLTKNASQSAPDLKVYKIDVKQKELAKLCQEFRQRLADRRISYQDVATQLYNLLLKPGHIQLTGKSNLIIIPDDVLWELPFQALQPVRNHFLIEDAAISYAPSLTVLQHMKQTRQKRSAMPANTLLAFGNPIIDTETSARVKTVPMDGQLFPLPEAERQVKLLQKLYTPSRSKIYIGKEAGEAKVKAEAGNSRILHLATHGILNDASPMYSQIVLAHNEAGTNEDGLLEAWEIMNLELNADLVVLSACETARGKVGAGEGMIGLSWALFVAGSPATVVSQWKVESASTTQLMVAFHRNLQTATGKQSLKMTKAEAMRRAALKLLKTPNYKHPFYWAAFVVIGDAS